MEENINKALIFIANMIFWSHTLGMIFVLYGVLRPFHGMLWNIHLLVTISIIVGVIINECPLTTFERRIRRKAGQRNVPNRGSRYLEVFYNYTKIKLPNSTMRILGLIIFILGMSAHLI